VPGLALTFDDGPDPSGTPAVLCALRRAGTRATFFVIAGRAARHPGLLAAIRGAGHEVELHCGRHVRHTQATRSEIATDTREALAALRALGVAPRRWRTPWGVRAPWTGEVAAACGLELCGWSVDTHDWRGDAADAMLAAVGPALGPDAVVLMHDGIGPGARRRDCAQTAALIGPLVAAARGRVLRPGPVGAA
jgi:peptidoglycan/xylan/chitin deacetylase (PgdA/CDA1 family)